MSMVLPQEGPPVCPWHPCLHPWVKTGLPRSTVSRVLKRHGLGQLKSLEPKEPIRRYEKEQPGQLLHLDQEAGAFQSARAPSPRRPQEEVPRRRLGVCSCRGR